MKITYDNEVDAMYIYFPPAGPQTVGGTDPHQELKVEMDANNQLIAIQLLESSEFQLGHRLRYVLQHPGAVYDEESRTLRVEFGARDRSEACCPVERKCRRGTAHRSR